MNSPPFISEPAPAIELAELKSPPSTTITPEPPLPLVILISTVFVPELYKILLPAPTKFNVVTDSPLVILVPVELIPRLNPFVAVIIPEALIFLVFTSSPKVLPDTIIFGACKVSPTYKLFTKVPTPTNDEIPLTLRS